MLERPRQAARKVIAVTRAPALKGGAFMSVDTIQATPDIRELPGQERLALAKLYRHGSPRLSADRRL